MPAWEDVEDIQLLKTAQAGGVEAFGELYERYANQVFRYLYAHLDDPLDAEDLTGEVFIRAWRSLSNYREQGVPFAAYLYHIARNVLIDYIRRTKFLSQVISIGELELESDRLNPGDLALNQVEHEELRELMGNLRDDYREVLTLRFLSGLSPEETAQVMERSVGAVRVLQHRALAALRALLADRQRD